MSRMRVFVDTSVVGGCFDEKFAADSRRVLELARSGRLTVIVSEIILAELGPAPQPVRDLMDALPRSLVEVQLITDDVVILRDAYLAQGILTRRWIEDATHVATATVARADALVSWNFKHIVRLDRIKGFNQVNLANGYGILTILSPAELREYETRDDTGV